MGRPLCPQEVDVLNGMPLSPYYSDMLENLSGSPSQEWRAQVAWLNSDRKESIKEVPEGPLIPSGTRRLNDKELEAEEKRMRLVEFMEENGGSITVAQARAVYGGSEHSCYKPMSMLVKAGIAEIAIRHPRIWRIRK